MVSSRNAINREMDVRSTLIANGWKQGTVLEEEFARTLYSEEEGEWYAVVVSQDCDLVCVNFKAEPCFETILFKPTKEKLGPKFAGQHPRIYRGPLIVAGDEIACEARIASRRLHRPRELLLENRARKDSSLPPDSLGKVRSWMAKKYDRYGRPEMFDAALKPYGALEAIDSIMEASGDSVDRLFISIEPDRDIGEGEKYVVDMILLYDLEKDGAATREAAEKAGDVAAAVFDVLSKVELIDQERLEVQAEAKQQLYVSELSGYHYFDYDYLSAEVDSEHKTYPEI